VDNLVNYIPLCVTNKLVPILKRKSITTIFPCNKFLYLYGVSRGNIWRTKSETVSLERLHFLQYSVYWAYSGICNIWSFKQFYILHFTWPGAVLINFQVSQRDGENIDKGFTQRLPPFYKSTLVFKWIKLPSHFQENLQICKFDFLIIKPKNHRYSRSCPFCQLNFFLAMFWC